MFKSFLDSVFIILQLIAPAHTLSRLISKLADSRIRWLKNFLINLAVDVFNINTEEAISSNPNDYQTFNDFFTRELKEGERPIEGDDNIVCSPSDGLVSQFGKIEHGQLIQAKGKYFTLQDLLAGNKELSEKFNGGEFATIYLSPKDYHRVHMPCEGQLQQSIYVPGALFSVNLTTANHINGLFARNERLINIFQSGNGPVAVILVGAMLVAGIETVWGGQVVPPKSALNTFSSGSDKDISLIKGEEMGRFKFGSTVILLFPKDTIEWNDSVKENAVVKMGESMARYIS